MKVAIDSKWLPQLISALEDDDTSCNLKIGYLKCAIHKMIELSIPLEEIIKPLLEDAFEKGNIAWALGHYEGKEEYITKTLENLRK